MDKLVKRVGETGGCTVLLKDTVSCKGTFLLHYLLRKLLSDTATRVLLLGLSDPFAHYNRIARKQGCNLQAWKDKGRFMFLALTPDVLESSLKGKGAEEAEAPSGALPGHSVANPLAALYLRIRDVARAMPVVESPRGSGQQTCIIIDDISVLDVLAGGEQDAVLDFLHYCKALSCGSQRFSVVFLTHEDIYEDPADSCMGLQLEYASDEIIRVEPLSTGVAADVHGQLTMSHRSGLSVEEQPEVLSGTRAQRLQFRVLENTVQFFLPGQL